ncbi:MAG: hypothetical protein OXF49_00920 [Candidatus Saccharibacteria bacterium]|nr:hypothetical protein [Candidatus Saccharibacteria bacterium]
MIKSIKFINQSTKTFRRVLSIALVVALGWFAFNIISQTAHSETAPTIGINVSQEDLSLDETETTGTLTLVARPQSDQTLSASSLEWRRTSPVASGDDSTTTVNCQNAFNEDSNIDTIDTQVEVENGQSVYKFEIADIDVKWGHKFCLRVEDAEKNIYGGAEITLVKTADSNSNPPATPPQPAGETESDSTGGEPQEEEAEPALPETGLTTTEYSVLLFTAISSSLACLLIWNAIRSSGRHLQN